MFIRILTSCTGKKHYSPENLLRREDFFNLHDSEAFQQIEERLADYRIEAQQMYTGQQHKLLMQGVMEYLDVFEESNLEISILSAGYGLIRGDQEIVPYEVTFQGMKIHDLLEWSEFLQIPRKSREYFAERADLTLVLLGEKYLRSLMLTEDVSYGSPVLFLSSEKAQRHIKGKGIFRCISPSINDAKRFSRGLVALKGELARRILVQAKVFPDIQDRLFDLNLDVLNWLERTTLPPMNSDQDSGSRKDRKVRIVRPELDKVISIPNSWWEKPHREKVRYFIPECDDLVDPYFDFLEEAHSSGIGGWENQVYAHQMFPEPNYDGILISKIVAEKSFEKSERINALGVHRYCRVPRSFPIMGDCGAFGYIDEEVPPYTTPEILDYYTRLDFDYGVSIDHLIVKATENQRKFRYELTIHNAEEFLKEHRKAGLSWTPVGVVQGWDPVSYAKAVKDYVNMGYRYIAMGGLARTNTAEILRILEIVRPVLPENVDLHLFGVARLPALKEFHRFGVRSADSASNLRQAWLGARQNYFTLNGDKYAAIRIPEGGKSFRAKRMVNEGRARKEDARKKEYRCLKLLREYDRGIGSMETVLQALEEYDVLISEGRKFQRGLFERVLMEQPWKKCDCPICRKDGIEVIIFRGNNRNRRRGFHNTYVFYRLFQDILNGKRDFSQQLSLGMFEDVEEAKIV